MTFGRTELKIVVSEAKNCEESAGQLFLVSNSGVSGFELIFVSGVQLKNFWRRAQDFPDVPIRQSKTNYR